MPTDAPLAQTLPDAPPKADTPLVEKVDPPVRPEPRPNPVPPTPRAPDPLVAAMVKGTFGSFATPLPPEPTRVAVRELTKEPIAKQVAAELGKSNALEIELTVLNNREAMARLRQALKKYQVELEVDPASANRPELLVYADNLKADELAKILRELAVGDKKANPFDTVAVAALSEREQHQVVALFGEDPTKRVDPNARKGMKNQPDVKPPAKLPPRIAAVLPPAPSAERSMEIRRFLVQPIDPGSLRVLVRIRQK